MSIANDVKSDIKAAKRMRLPRWAILPGIVVSFLFAWLFDNFGRLNLMLPIWNSVAVFGFMLALKRKLWRHAWFWITMTTIAALHAFIFCELIRRRFLRFTGTQSNQPLQDASIGILGQPPQIAVSNRGQGWAVLIALAIAIWVFISQL